jgi:hypothetical protein
MRLIEEFLDRHPDFAAFVLDFYPWKGRKPHRLVIHSPGLPLHYAFSVLRASDVFLGVDSCMLHAADLYRLPGVGLFGRANIGFASKTYNYRQWGFRFSRRRQISDARGMNYIREPRVLAALERAVQRGIAALCAEAVGAMEATNATTIEYTKSRKQFGQPIGRFQALQHRMADMFVQATQARSMSILAAGRCAAHVHQDEGDAAQRRRDISAAKCYVGKAARFVGQQAVQLHGGMGMADELPVSHYFKRLTMLELAHGDTLHHLGEVSERMQDTAGVFA